jgi:hypothetical protein
LNLPDKVTPGKRLKCPKCGSRFVVTVEDASSESTMPGLADADPATLFELEQRPPSRDDLPTPRRGPGLDDLPLPVAEGDLRETFNLPLVSGREAERAEVAAGPADGDAAALFEDRAGPQRRTTAGDARRRARRCSHCGGLVPQGMSICVSCGCDQESGLRVGLEDDLVPSAPPRPQGPPVHIAVTGGLCAAAGSILLILSLIQSVRGSGRWENYGWLCLALVSAFGIFAAVQFIRGRSAKPLMLALSLGVIIDLMGMVAFPLIQANLQAPDRIVSEAKAPDLDASDIEIKPNVERLDARSIEVGIILVGIYVMLSVYLMSPLVKKYFHSR